jgi:hypothetical protein
MTTENKTKRGRGRPRKDEADAPKEMGDLTQVTGRDDANKKFKPMTMEQVWGGDGTGPTYNTLDSEAYTEHLTTLNRADLYKHATRIGLVPIDNTGLLKKRLVAEHRRHCALYKYPHDLKQKTAEETAAMEKRVKEIMG